MDLQTVQRAWMEPATDSKKKMRTSRFLGRRLLGEKGVGRFAAARLAEELELATRVPGADTEVFAFFDWTQFDTEDLYLDQVLILTEQRTPEDIVEGRGLPSSPEQHDGLPRDGTHGTLLRMNNLKRTWGGRELKGLQRGLSRLISPFDEDRDFRILLQLPGETTAAAQEVAAPQIIHYPHYELGGEIDSKGKYVLTIRLHAEEKTAVIEGLFRRSVRPKDGQIAIVSRENQEAGELIDTLPITCGPISFRILVWNRDELDNVEQKLGVGIQSIRQDLDAIAGISIYRDGFRVLPYGEPDDDWLRLDIRRVQNPTMRLSNNQITGIVRISADTNPLLRDQSNREGLDQNAAYADLQGLMVLSLSKLEELRYRDRRPPKGHAKATVGGLLDVPDVGSLRQQLTSKLPAGDEVLESFDNTMRKWEEQIVRIRGVLSQYHSLATLGQLIDKVVHDTRQPLSTIQGQTGMAREALANMLHDPSFADGIERLTKADGRMEQVQDAARLIHRVLARIEPLGGRQSGKPKKLYIEEIIVEAFRHFEAEIRELGVRVTTPKDSNLVTVDSAEIEEVFINLISNSLYWLSQVPKTGRAIVVQCARPQPGELEILFADSGPGIPRENRDSVFEPYFSTKPEGVGLGLVIAGEIVRDYYGGMLELLDSGPLGGAVFRVLLRRRV
jgi:signal transduction histidine kinase